jgi:signal transduction histidine kinase
MYPRIDQDIEVTAEGLPPIEGDRVQLQQVILNLTINAIEAMSGTNGAPREMLLSTEKTEPDAVRARCGTRVRDWRRWLSSASSIPSIRPNRAVLGLGLSICRSIIEAHGGRLWASVNMSRGAIFQFTVPALTQLPFATIASGRDGDRPAG